MSEFTFIKTENLNEGRVLKITLNRPELHNAFNDAFIAELSNYLRELKTAEKAPQLLVLTGAGKSFCAGADLNWMKSMKDYSAEENYQDSVRLSELFEELNSMPMPVIGVVNGAALGGGTGLVASCDYVIASDSALFGFTEVALGLVPGVISPYVMAKIGESQARAYFLSGQKFDGKKAMQMGLVHQVEKDDSLEEASKKQIERFLRAGPVAQREAKILINGVLKHQRNGNSGTKEFTCRTIARVRTSVEGQEGMAALLEKRPAAWIKN